MTGPTPHLSRDLDRGIKACEGCHDACLEALKLCRRQDGSFCPPEHVELLMDALSLCRTTGEFLLRGSTQAPLVAHVCAEICSRTALAFADRPEVPLRRCAEACRDCAMGLEG